MTINTSPVRTAPSLSRLTDAFGVEAARKLRRLFKSGSVPAEWIPETEKWIHSCYHAPSAAEVTECAAAEITGAYGTDVLDDNDGAPYPNLTCTNSGDTYSTCLVFEWDRRHIDRVIVSTAGDEIERRKL